MNLKLTKCARKRCEALDPWGKAG